MWKRKKRQEMRLWKVRGKASRDGVYKYEGKEVPRQKHELTLETVVHQRSLVLDLTARK